MTRLFKIEADPDPVKIGDKIQHKTATKIGGLDVAEGQVMIEGADWVEGEILNDEIALKKIRSERLKFQ